MGLCSGSVPSILNDLAIAELYALNQLAEAAGAVALTRPPWPREHNTGYDIHPVSIEAWA